MSGGVPTILIQCIQNVGIYFHENRQCIHISKGNFTLQSFPAYSSFSQTFFAVTSIAGADPRAGLQLTDVFLAAIASHLFSFLRHPHISQKRMTDTWVSTLL